MGMSQLELLRSQNPEYPFPPNPEPRDYPKELGADLGDKRRFGWHIRTLLYRTSSEEAALKYANTHDGVITFNPIRLETYGVWVKK